MPFTYHVGLAYKMLHLDYDRHKLTNFKTEELSPKERTPVSPTERPGFSR